ncbi:MAG: ABC transporter substrate-binding protein [Chloroflexota bacterium]|nr:ABC transporter substrate-binding protein [Chloroflexota bacterium]
MKSVAHHRWWFLVVVMLVFGAMLGACAGAEEEPAGEGEVVEPVEEEVVEPAEEEVEPVEEEVEPAEEEVEEEAVEEEAVEEEAVEPADVEGVDAPVVSVDDILNPEVEGSVEFWHFWGSPARRTAIRRVVAMCEEKLPNITITETFKPWGDIWTANVAAVAAGTGMPDVIVEDRPQLPQRGRDQIATNLQPFIEQDNFDPSVFWDWAWEETLLDGESYGIPHETDVRVLFYNKTAMEEAGLDPEDPPETWDEVIEMGNALDVQEGDAWTRIGFLPHWKVGPDFWAYTNGWEAVVDGVPNVNDPAYIETVSWMNERIDHYGDWETLQNFQASYGSPPNDLFMSGAVPLMVDVAGYMSQLNFYRPEIEWGIAPIPYNEEPANWSGGFALAIPRGAPNPEAAWEFIKCATSMEGQTSWARDTFSIPTNKAAATATELMADPNWEIVINELQHSRGSGYVAEYPNWPQELGPRLEEVWTDQTTPEEMAEEAQQAIEEVIAENQ